MGHRGEGTAIARVHLDSGAWTLKTIAQAGYGAYHDHGCSTTVLECYFGRRRKVRMWTSRRPRLPSRAALHHELSSVLPATRHLVPPVVQNKRQVGHHSRAGSR